MAALGIHKVLPPRSIWERRWIVVLVCYLDDSGRDSQSRITTIAGYAAREEEWRTFEAEVEPVFTEYAVRTLHAKDLHHTDGEFRGWPILRKQAFVAKLCRVMSRHVLLGMSMSALKSVYKDRAAESDRKRTVTPYTFCSNVLIDWVMRDIRVGRVSNIEGVAFVHIGARQRA